MPNTKMKFSEAIELGNTMAGECHNAFFHRDSKGNACKACLIGAAFLAVRELTPYTIGSNAITETWSRWPWTAQDAPKEMAKDFNYIWDIKETSIAELLSLVHSWLKMPRMEMLPIVKKWEAILDTEDYAQGHSEEIVKVENE